MPEDVLFVGETFTMKENWAHETFVQLSGDAMKKGTLNRAYVETCKTLAKCFYNPYASYNRVKHKRRNASVVVYELSELTRA